MGGQLPIVGTTLRQRTQGKVDDARLQASLEHATDEFGRRKAAAYEQFADPDALREAARAMKAEVLARLDEVLASLADRLEAAGAQVHWAATAHEARQISLALVGRDGGPKRVVKSKSMLSEEIGLNHALEDAGHQVTETDLVV